MVKCRGKEKERRRQREHAKLHIDFLAPYPSASARSYMYFTKGARIALVSLSIFCLNFNTRSALALPRFICIYIYIQQFIIRISQCPFTT